MSEMRSLLDEAREIAREAHEENFSSRRGTGAIDDLAVYLYDNNPYSQDAGQREREHAALKLDLQELGFELLAVARYPTAGESAEYTVSIVWCPPDEMDVGEAEAALVEAWERRMGEKWGPDEPTHHTRTGRGIRVIKGGKK